MLLGVFRSAWLAHSIASSPREKWPLAFEASPNAFLVATKPLVVCFGDFGWLQSELGFIERSFLSNAKLCKLDVDGALGSA